MTKHRIESDAVREIFTKWVIHKNKNVERVYYPIRETVAFFQREGFVDYIWSCGGRIYQENKKCYIEFFDEYDLTMFLLRWS